MLIACLGVARSAEAQWYFAGYLGANTTQSADVAIEIPASSLALEFHDVKFDAHPFESPQYYGWRLGHMFGATRRFGVELEFTHLKVIAQTGESYETSGASGLVPFTAGTPMGSIVERYSMTHGLNFVVGNVVVREPIGSGRAAFVGRAGAGGTIPHTETTVLGGAVDQYEFAGAGFHLAAGIDVRLNGRLSFVAEYKYTHARPEITVAGGSGRTTAATHHVAAGLAFGMSR
jgi:opacity protein-like surface antigen